MLYTKCIISPKSLDDGLRISVMSRHTLNDGVTPDARISSNDIHLPILGPKPLLIGDYHKRNLPWEEFEKRYVWQLQDPKVKAVIEALAVIALKTTVTLLCIEETAEYCHRRLLANEFRKYAPDLKIIHR